MRRIVYIGTKSIKNDNIAQTGLVWTPGAVLDVHDDAKAKKLCEHIDVWRDVTDKQPSEIRAMLRPEPVSKPVEEPKPRLQVQPQGGSNASPFWDPIVIPVSEKVFADLQEGRCAVMFALPEDVKLFDQLKAEQKAMAEKRSDSERQQEQITVADVGSINAAEFAEV